ncbi:MAG: adenosylhomocysteinase [Candidatus Nezhaarchaeota archaeon]|nr:adenosylhomocysteinase [Candidatus Nezhaarchaeota archaeon]
MGFKVKDLSLASEGRLLIEWAEVHMPVLLKIRERFRHHRPLRGLRIGCCLHVTKETAVLVRTLMAGGGEVYLAGSNPLSTQDSVAAALAAEGAHVYAWRGESIDEYYWCINKVIESSPHITMDDGGDLTFKAHEAGLEGVLGGTEETTTGVNRLRAMEREGKLRYPIIAVNDAYSKYLFDNRYGTGQSTIDGVLRATNILLAGKTLVVAGYGWCGRGVAMRARGMGANVIVTEVDPLKALEAVMDGFRVTSMREAAKVGDVFITVTGNINVVRGEHFKLMKDGAILANSGHFNVEISIPDLERMSKSKRKIRENLEEYVLVDGKRLYLLAEGRLVNLAAAEGHPSEVMDMSFSNQALSVEFLASNPILKPGVYRVPEEIDRAVAKMKLEAMGVEIDELTEEQQKYLSSWGLGT